jgi:anti-anti-sigma factor
MDATEVPVQTISATDAIPQACWVPVAVAGEIDLATAPDMLATVLAAAKPETAGIMVDVSAVTFIGAEGLNFLIRARNDECEHGRDVVLRSPPLMMARMLEICDLADLVQQPQIDGGVSVAPEAGR